MNPICYREAVVPPSPDDWAQKYFAMVIDYTGKIEAERRERLIEDALISGAMRNELCAVQIGGLPMTWRLW